MQILGEREIRAALPYGVLIPAMERALIDFSAGRVVQPVRGMIPVSAEGAEGIFALMPAVYGKYMGAKMVCVYPGNVALGLPTHLASVQLFRAKTGEPLAVLDGTVITELRTAAVSAVAAKRLARVDAKVLGVLGSGVQARAHIEALRAVRRFDDIRIWSRAPANAATLAKAVGGVATSAEEAARGADVIVTATGAGEPVLRGAWVGAGACVLAVGAVGAGRREVDTDVMTRATVVVDSRAAARVEAGDILLAGVEVDAELGDVLANTVVLPERHHTVFKSLGLAVEDIASAAIVYEARGTVGA
jgi:ornithine cyclodeaminase/alanine dehydrogenase-like protein (mu-crystallin family)